jgi:hypothetical protein
MPNSFTGRNYRNLLANNDLRAYCHWTDSQIPVHLTQQVVDFSQAPNLTGLAEFF